MPSVLQEIKEYTLERIKKERTAVPIELLKEKCRDVPLKKTGTFADVLKKNGMSFICEIKKASPSKGVISEDFPYMNIAGEYERAGADCISCLTEPHWFMGSDKIFKEVRGAVKIPMLRKDFTVDEYQIYQAKLMGADAVLLICSILSTADLEKYLKICSDLSIDALVETHNAVEISAALSAGAEIIGVNNRNLNDFSVDFSNAAVLRGLVPSNKLFISESGVHSADDIKVLKEIGADGVLIGETLMRAENKSDMLKKLRGDL